MKDFRKQGGQGGGRDGNFESRGNYNKYQGGRDSGAPRAEFKHKAVCSECHNTCEVPFRPNGTKPVYCSDCFGKRKGAYPSNNENREFTPRAPAHHHEERPMHHSAPAVHHDTHHIEDIKKQMDIMHSKLERVLKMLEGGVNTAMNSAIKSAPKQIEKFQETFQPKNINKTIAVVKKEEAKVVKAVKKSVAKIVAKAKPKTKKKK